MSRGVAHYMKNMLCNSSMYRYLCVFVLVNMKICEYLYLICKNLVDICDYFKYDSTLTG